MSLYNMLHGRNPMSDALLAVLGLTQADVGRFRDTYLDGDLIAVYTRNGGGNRKDYQAVIDTLRAHDCFVRDEDDDFDCTYATFWFTVPVGLEGLVASMRREDETKPADRMAELLRQLHEEPESPAAKHAMDRMRPVMEQIAGFLKAQSRK